MMAPNIIYCAPIPFNIVFHNANKGKMRINVLDLSRFCCAVGPFRLVFLSDLPSLSLCPPFPSSFHRWTRHFASFDTEGERGEEQPSWKYSFPLSRAPRVFFFSKSLPFRSSSPLPFLFLLFFFFFLPFPSLPLEKLFRRRCTRKNDTSLFRGRNDENFNR